MNIFFLDADPIQAAKYVHDIHTRSQTNESTQLLSGWSKRFSGLPQAVDWFAENKQPIIDPPGPWVGEQNPLHPCAVWLDEGLGNVKWLVLHLSELIRQYDMRHKNTDTEKFKNARNAVREMKEWLSNFVMLNRTAPAQAYGPNRDQYYTGPTEADAIEGYRKYYIAEKFPGNTWSPPASKPEWIIAPLVVPKAKISPKGLRIGKPSDATIQITHEQPPVKTGIGSLKIKRN